MEKATAVNTCLGVLMGRDCIYLDQVKQDALNNLTFTGDIPTHSPSGGCWPILPANWTPMKIWLGWGIWMAVLSI
mgnify:CR=1 FL=1